jgi:hypothetical protein
MSVKWKLFKTLSEGGVSAMWLMQDGSVLANLYGQKVLVALRPDNKGSYANGTWSHHGRFNLEKLFFSSAVLSDGRLVACGGEDWGPNYPNHTVESNICEIYDFFNEAATEAVKFPPPTGWTQIGDAPSVVLNDGTFMMGNSSLAFSNTVALLDATQLTWTFGGGDGYQEETWTLLQTGDVLTTSCTNRTSERYNASGNPPGFVPDKNLPVTIGDTVHTETGPAITMMDGRVICFGALGRTCIYTAGLQGQEGSWVRGPNLPINPRNGEQLGAADVGAILEPNGKVLLLVQGLRKATDKRGHTPSAFVEYDPVHGFGPLLRGAPNSSSNNVTRMLLLPNGHGLIIVAQSGKCYDLTFDEGGDASWAPTITSFPGTVITGTTVTLAGKQLCGLSECQSFGDDNQQAENYPMVRFVDHHGDVTYARAHDVSTRSIAPGKASTVLVDIPPSLVTGKYTVYAVAMGIPSRGVTVEVHQIGKRLPQLVGDMDGDGLDEILVTGPWGIAILKQSHHKMIPLVSVANGVHIGGWKLETASNNFRLVANFDRDRASILVTSRWGIAILKLDSGKLVELTSARNGHHFGHGPNTWKLDSASDVFGPVADFDGDGQNEVLVTSGWGLGVLKYSNGSFTPITIVANGTNMGGWTLNTSVDRFGATADFNQGGQDQVFVTSPSGVTFLTLDSTATATSNGLAPNGSDLGGWKLETSNNVFGQAGNYIAVPSGFGVQPQLFVSGPHGIAILAPLSVLAFFPNGHLPGDQDSGDWHLQTGASLFGPAADYDGDLQDEVLVTSSLGIGVLSFGMTVNVENGAGAGVAVWETIVLNGDSVGAWSLDARTNNFGAAANYSPSYGQPILGQSQSVGGALQGPVQAGVFVTGPVGIGILKFPQWQGLSSPMMQLNGAPFGPLLQPDGTHSGHWLLDTAHDQF